jgi:DNA adenine methylase
MTQQFVNYYDDLKVSENGKIEQKGKIPRFLSPLRYPGSKRKLVNYIETILNINNLHPSLFIEPFAGGASVSLNLLAKGKVDQIGLIDLDPLVASFWRTVFNSTDVNWLIDEILAVDVNLDKWKQLKESQPVDERELAFKCLFLNRTSFSGLLTDAVGPIGGKNQLSDYAVSCRFNKEDIVKRIRYLAKFQNRVAFVWQDNWKNAFLRIREMQRRDDLPKNNLFFYLDPPFFKKAEDLYRFYFTDSQHIDLRDFLITLSDNWLLSYDYVPRVDELYNTFQGRSQFHMTYTLSGNGGGNPGRVKRSEAVISNLSNLPVI